jgi:hypothetical protein
MSVRTLDMTRDACDPRGLPRPVRVRRDESLLSLVARGEGRQTVVSHGREPAPSTSTRLSLVDVRDVRHPEPAVTPGIKTFRRTHIAQSDERTLLPWPIASEPDSCICNLRPTHPAPPFDWALDVPELIGE